MSQQPPRSGGTYVLIFYAPQETRVVVGALGETPIESGYYLYVGSAHGGGGLQARICRHLKLNKPVRWHMDYLRPLLKLQSVWWQSSPQRLEDSWVAMMPQLGVKPYAKGFGASDSRHGTHLFFSDSTPKYKLWKSLAPATHCWENPDSDALIHAQPCPDTRANQSATD